VIARLRQYAQYRSVFRTHQDVLAYRRVRDYPQQCTGPVPLGIRGLREAPLLCRPRTMDPITLWDAFHAGYHLPDFELPDRCTILDLGANAGYTAASFAIRYPRARIVAVEMDEDNAALCARNVAQFGTRCQVVHAAVWSEPGAITYGGGNVHDYSVLSTTGSRLKTARAVTIGGLLTELQIERVDYLKMDIEGAEGPVLHDAREWAPRVLSLSVEVHPPCTIGECKAALEREGFSCRIHGTHSCALIATRRPSRGARALSSRARPVP
jgi:FkbM family methyltransferase